MKFLKKFETTSQYNAYTADTANFVTPNVSLIEETHGVAYHPAEPTETRVVATFNVTSTSNSTQIIGDFSENPFSAIEIDGVEQPSVVTEYTFSTTGGHTVKYTLTDPTSIGDNAFTFCRSLTSVTIPNSVTSIGADAFFGCDSLTSITIPNSVTSIGETAFFSCGNLTSITVDSNNTVYDSRNNCNAIIEKDTNTLIQGCNNTVIPNTVTSIGENAFAWCEHLTSIDIPNSVTSIGSEAFCMCTGLTSVTIPNSVTNIGDEAFLGCESLTSITIPNSVTSIGEKAFASCYSLTSINIPSGVETIGNYAFCDCESLDIVSKNAISAINQTALECEDEDDEEDYEEEEE